MIKNYFSLIISQIVGRIISFFWVIYLARIIGVENYGHYGAIMAIISIGTSFVDFGVHYIVVQEGVRKPEELPFLIGSQIFIRATISVVVSLFIIVMSVVTGKSTDIHLLELACLHMIFHNLGLIGDTVFSAVKKQKLIATMSIIHTTGWAVLGFLVLYKFSNLTALFIVMAVNSFIFLIINYWIVRNYCAPQWTGVVQRAKVLLLAGIPIGLTGVFSIIFQRIDRVLVVLIKGGYDAGIYNAVSTLISPIADFVWSMAIVVIYPYMVHLFLDKKKFEVAFKNIVIWLFAGMLFFSIPGVFFSNTIIKTVFGLKYADGTRILPILVFSYLAIPFHGFFGRMLLIQNQHKQYLYSNLAAAVLNSVTNLILIPKIGILGPCIAAVVTNFSLIFFYSYLSSESFRQYIRFDQVAFLSLAAVMIALIAKLTQVIHPFVPFFVFIAVYCPVAFLILDLRRQWTITQKALN